MASKRRRWDHAVEDDPLTGLVNLFDLWMVFSIALLLALVSHFNLQKPERQATTETRKDMVQNNFPFCPVEGKPI